MTAEEGSEPDPFAEERGASRRRRDGSYGGSTYASYNPPSWPVLSIAREPTHVQAEGFTGVIEGTVTWRGARPTVVKSSCGELPIVPRVGRDGAMGGVLVFIERVARGRVVTVDPRPATVGGSIAKRGCAFLPTAQIVAPLPAPLAIHGDAARVRLQIRNETAGPKASRSTSMLPIAVELQEAGRVALQAPTGITRVDDVDSTHAAAWVVALRSPAYTLTDDRGRYRIDELAPGTYEVTFWQAPIPTVTSTGTLAYGAPIVTKRSIHVASGTRSSRMDITLGR